MDTTYSFAPGGNSKTIVQIIESDPKGGAAFTDGGRSHKAQLENILQKLKNCVEEETCEVLDQETKWWQFWRKVVYNRRPERGNMTLLIDLNEHSPETVKQKVPDDDESSQETPAASHGLIWFLRSALNTSSRTCLDCNGTGCPYCDEKGRIRVPNWVKYNKSSNLYVCKHCGKDALDQMDADGVYRGLFLADLAERGYFRCPNCKGKGNRQKRA